VSPGPDRDRRDTIRQRQQLAEEAALHIRELITSGQLRPGEFLRTERFADELGISVTPVREAFLALKAEGFVTLEPRRGFVVAPLRRTDVRDLFLVQSFIAGELIARAVERISDATVKELRKTQATLEMAARDNAVDLLAECNYLFHRLINVQADSPKLLWALKLTFRYVPRRFYGAIEEWRDAPHEMHHAILDAIECRDAEAARELMANHIVNAGELLVRSLERRGFWDE
jgi:DNA-binding GntR family transcriptional regulator